MATCLHLCKSLLKMVLRSLPSRSTLSWGYCFSCPFPRWQSIGDFSHFCLHYFLRSRACGLFFTAAKLCRIAKRPLACLCERFFAITAFFICNLLAFWTGWNTLSKILLTIVIGYVLLAVFKFTKEGRPLELHMKSGLWLFPYYVGLGIISYLGTFGEGKNIISFGWDFLIIFLFSLGIYFLSQISMMRPTKPYEKKTKELPVI